MQGVTRQPARPYPQHNLSAGAPHLLNSTSIREHDGDSSALSRMGSDLDYEAQLDQLRGCWAQAWGPHADASRPQTRNLTAIDDVFNVQVFAAEWWPALSARRVQDGTDGGVSAAATEAPDGLARRLQSAGPRGAHGLGLLQLWWPEGDADGRPRVDLLITSG